MEGLESRVLFAVNIGINAGVQHQTIDGFGTMAPATGAGVSQMYYQDLGSSMVRLQLNQRALRAAGDTGTTPTQPVTLGSDLQQNIAKFNFGAERVGGPLSIVRDSKTLAPGTKVIASLWTPPHWMKGAELNPYSGEYLDTDPNAPGTQYRYPHINYYGNDSSGGSLIDTPENLTQFARYVAAYVKGAEQATGVPIYAVSIQNELAFWEPYDSCVYSPQMYVKALKAVSAEFDRVGITTKLQGPEDVGVGSTNDPWAQWRQFQYINAIRNDPTAMAALDIYSIHGYANDGITANRSPAMWSQYWNGRSQTDYPSPAGAWWTGLKNDGKRSWMTETSGEPQTFAGALNLASNAQDALTQGNVSAWVYWQTGDGGTTPSQYTLTSGTDTTTKKYNAAKHFFKYIRPGAVRVEAAGSSTTGVYASAFLQPTDKTLTSVLINLTGSAQTVNLNLSGLDGLTRFDINRRTSAGETWLDAGPLSVANRTVSLNLPAGSIVTLRGSTAAPVAQTGKVTGRVFNDVNANGTQASTGEAGIGGRIVFYDANNNGSRDAGEIGATTNSAGDYALSNIPAGSNRVIRQIVPANFQQTTPTNNAAIVVSLTAGQTIAGRLFGTRSIAPQTLQSETASLNGGTAASRVNGGYFGTGYADYGGANSAVTYTVTRAVAETNSLSFRYANGGTTSRPLSVIVNGVTVGSVACAPTGSWTTWKTVSINAPLKVGVNTIKAVASTSAGGANVDQLTVGPATVSRTTYQAESTFRSSGTALRTSSAGYTGSGYVNLGSAGSYLQFTVARPTAGATTVKIRYANGSTLNRPIHVSLNGAATQSNVALPPTGSGTTWKELTLTLNLAAGANTLRLTSAGAAGADIDAIVVG